MEALLEARFARVRSQLKRDHGTELVPVMAQRLCVIIVCRTEDGRWAIIVDRPKDTSAWLYTVAEDHRAALRVAERLD